MFQAPYCFRSRDLGHIVSFQESFHAGLKTHLLACHFSKSSSYEAAKEAWNKANSAQNTANIINNNLNKLTGDSSNYSQLNDASASYWDFTVDGTSDSNKQIKVKTL